MIQTNLAQCLRYYGTHPMFPVAFKALRALADKPFRTGRHDVAGEALFINALEYETNRVSESVFEAHQHYIDIMMVLEGEERIGCQEVQKLSHITKAYDEADDVLLAEMEKDFTHIHMMPGSIAIFFPEDAHAPNMDWNGTGRVKKLIAKVLVSARPDDK